MRAVAPTRWSVRFAALVVAAAAVGGCKTTTTVTRSSDTAEVSGASAEGDPHRRAAVRLQLAGGYYQKGQVEIALKEVKEAIALDPGLASAYGLLGLIYMDLQQSDNAEDSFRRAMQLNPRDPDLNNDYGWFLCRTRRERESIAYFDKAAGDRLYTTPAMALQNAGICLIQIGDNQKGEKYLTRAFEADASSPVAKFQLAQLYLQTHRLDRATFYYELLAKSVDPNAQTLWLGTRIAHAKADATTQRRLGEELRTRFPNAPETALLNREAFNE
jgi:type IV pilus assembly protein PilF